jgi:DNA transposition AAA+ family ATPase
MSEIKLKVENYIAQGKANGRSQASIAKELGISTSALSQYLQDKYPGNVEAIENKARELFEILEKAAAVTKAPKYVDTSISHEVYAVINYCHFNRCIGFVIGDAGIGKTKAALKYTSDKSETIYITATKACKSLKDIYRMIARKLKISENRNMLDLQFDIRSKLDGSNKIIIIDEAQHLTLAAIDGIRYFNDAIESEDDEMAQSQPVGIVFIGNHELNSKMLGRNEQSYDQVFSRIQMKRFLCTSHVQVDDIKKLFPELVEKNMDKEIKLLHAISQSRWGVRGAVKIFQNASNNADITYDGLLRMTKVTGISISG